MPPLWRVTVVLAALLASASLILSAILFTEVHDIATDSEGSLCALRHDVERRIAASEEFLEENPQGAGGITPAVIQQGIDNQRATIDALSDLSCSEYEIR